MHYIKDESLHIVKYFIPLLLLNCSTEIRLGKIPYMEIFPENIYQNYSNLNNIEVVIIMECIGSEKNTQNDHLDIFIDKINKKYPETDEWYDVQISLSEFANPKDVRLSLSDKPSPIFCFHFKGYHVKK